MNISDDFIRNVLKMERKYEEKAFASHNLDSYRLLNSGSSISNDVLTFPIFTNILLNMDGRIIIVSALPNRWFKSTRRWNKKRRISFTHWPISVTPCNWFDLFCFVIFIVPHRAPIRAFLHERSKAKNLKWTFLDLKLLFFSSFLMPNPMPGYVCDTQSGTSLEYTKRTLFSIPCC